MRGFVLSGMALIAATYGLARFGYGLFLPRFMEEFGISSAVSGFIQAGSFLSFCVAAFIATLVSTHPRRVVMTAGATASLGSLGVALSPNAGVLAVSIVVAGAGAGFATPGLVTLVQNNVSPQRRENAQTTVNAGTGAGIVIAGLLLFATVSQWRLGWAAIALAAAAAAVSTLVTDRSQAQHPSGGRSPSMSRSHWRALAWPFAAAILAGASSAGIWTFGRTIMAETSGGGEVYSVIAWMLLGGFGVLGLGAGHAVHALSLRTAWSSITFAMGAATVVLGSAPGSMAAAYVSAAAFGATYTAVSGLLIVWAERAVPDRASTGTAALFIALAVGQAAGSAILGVLLDPASPAPAFIVAGLFAVLAILPTLLRSEAGLGLTRRAEPAAL
ncbi:MFS transporter [Nesterenkonia sp. NBAIMH1]|uniref:MFS transporter n=1 Tax=Nesterenkonia sp. NBAIMH1 TaxID=2600320 RepID=UPI00143D5A93|nr:MFS transporter [Nesterenkonia sp. NBAIMH1]